MSFMLLPPDSLGDSCLLTDAAEEDTTKVDTAFARKKKNAPFQFGLLSAEGAPSLRW